jgi:hypothetical protein
MPSRWLYVVSSRPFVPFIAISGSEKDQIPRETTVLTTPEIRLEYMVKTITTFADEIDTHHRSLKTLDRNFLEVT